MEWNIAQDVDECLVNSVPKHALMTPVVARKMGYTSLAQVHPSYEDMMTSGGSHKVFGHLEGYAQVNEFLRNDPDFNRGLKPLPGAIDALNLLQRNLSVYLTTRPAHLARLTLEELVENGFPERRVITRPNDVPVDRTSEWKVWMLGELSRADGLAKVMIDDSAKMHTAIKDKRSPKIRGILYDGPITPRGMGLSWEEIADLLLATEDWKSLRHILTRRARN
jgi:hypothetical protein